MIFSVVVSVNRDSVFNLNLPYILIAKSPKIEIIKIMEDINKNLYISVIIFMSYSPCD